MFDSIKIKKILLLFFYLLLFATCKKETVQSDAQPEKENVQKKEAILRWTGAYAVDGCGFFFIISDSTYKPDNENDINDEYQKYGDVNVVIEFEFLNKQLEYYCGDAPFPMKTEGIKIISIKKE